MTQHDQVPDAPNPQQQNDGRPQPAQEPQPATPAPVRHWTSSGETFLRDAFAGSRYEYDPDREQTRISHQIDHLRWRLPHGQFPFSPAYFLKAVIKQLPLATVEAVAINGHLACPDGPDEIADYALYGVEGTAHGIRQRIYLLDTGTAGVILAVDDDVPEPALTPPPVDLTNPDPA